MSAVEFATRCAALRHRGLSAELMHQLQDAGNLAELVELEAATDEQLVEMSRLGAERDAAVRQFSAAVAQAPCEAYWGFDVDFDVTCQRQGKHTTHRTEIEGNDGVPAVIEWPTAPQPATGLMPGGYLLSTPRDMPRGALKKRLDEGPPPPPERPAPLPNPVERSVRRKRR